MMFRRAGIKGPDINISSNYYFLFFFFCVTVPPRIAPFSFNKDLSEGVRTQVTCMIEKGDPPFTITWLKNGDQIGNSGSPTFASGSSRGIQSPGLKVTSLDAHSSTILIETVRATHTGNYTCVARNSVAEVSWTAELVVSGKVDCETRRHTFQSH